MLTTHLRLVLYIRLSDIYSPCLPSWSLQEQVFYLTYDLVPLVSHVRGPTGLAPSRMRVLFLKPHLHAARVHFVILFNVRQAECSVNNRLPARTVPAWCSNQS